MNSMNYSSAVRPWEDSAVSANGHSVKENFNSWIEGTAARNSDGSPVVVFRGDKEKFDDFEGRRESGIFFALEPKRAEFYGEVRQYCLQARNPIDLTNPYETWRAGGVGAEIIETIFSDHHDGDHDAESGEKLELYDIISAIEHGNLWQIDGAGGFNMYSWRALQNLCKANGFDAMIVPDAGEGCGAGVDWVVFDSKQVKCISEHAGLFIAQSNSLTDFNENLALDQSKAALDLVNSVNSIKSLSRKSLLQM